MYEAANADPNHFVHTVANYLMGFGGTIAAVILIVIGFKVLLHSGRSGAGSGQGSDGASGIRMAIEEAGGVLFGLFFIFGAFFLVGVITAVVNALQK